MSIYATLHIHPTARPTHEMIYITRGASAILVYPLFDKPFTLGDIEQLTVILKQGRDFYGYSMIDEAAAPGTLNSHFYISDDSSYPAVIFTLESAETKQFKAGVALEYEIAIKLNTDSFATLGGKDSVIIEPQHPIAVLDSLYSYIEEDTNVN